MIKQLYDDGKKHVHVLSFGAGTQSTALLLLALRGEVAGIIPDYIIFSDTGWEPGRVYDWVEKVQAYVKQHYRKQIHVTTAGNIRKDFMSAIETGERVASMPLFLKGDEGKNEGMVMRQCTKEYKLEPITRKIRELLGYKPRQRVREVVHMWKGISTDEISRVKPSRTRWIVHEHPLVDLLHLSRTDCIRYVESLGLGTPPKSSCIGCPFHDNAHWRDMKNTDPEAWADAVAFDKSIRRMPRVNKETFLHRSCKPLDEIDFDALLWAKDNQLDMFDNECEGMCGV